MIKHMNSKTLIVLGRGISKEGNLPPMSVRSVEKAQELLVGDRVGQVLFCGKWSRHFDYLPPKTEAAAMRELALSLGVPEERIFVEDQSLDTISNLYYAKKRYLAPNGWHDIMLLTMYETDERGVLVAKCMLGPAYAVEGVPMGYALPSEKAEYIVRTEREKVAIFRKFVRENQIEAGDDERLFREHQRYVAAHDLPATFRD